MLNEWTNIESVYLLNKCIWMDRHSEKWMFWKKYFIFCPLVGRSWCWHIVLPYSKTCSTIEEWVNSLSFIHVCSHLSGKVNMIDWSPDSLLPFIELLPIPILLNCKAHDIYIPLLSNIFVPQGLRLFPQLSVLSQKHMSVLHWHGEDHNTQTEIFLITRFVIC